jgi:hypothetical protein
MGGGEEETTWAPSSAYTQLHSLSVLRSRSRIILVDPERNAASSLNLLFTIGSDGHQFV